MIKSSLRKQTRLRMFLFPLAFLLAFSFISFCSTPVQAKSYEEVAQFSIKSKYWSDSATMTKKYYVFVEKQMENQGKKHIPSSQVKSYLYRCPRSNPKKSNCIKTKQQYKWGHVLTILHKWDTDYVLIRSDMDKDKACWDIESFKIVSMSKCSSWAPKKVRLKMKTYGAKQSYVKYGKYYIRAFGNDDEKLHLVLYDGSKKTKNGQFKILVDINFSQPKKLHELEGVMVDGDTGTVYFTSVTKSNPRAVHFNKLTSTAFDKYLKPLAANSGNEESGGGGEGESEGGGESDDQPGSNSGHNSTYQPAQSQYNGEICTVFFGCIKDDGSGCGVYLVLNTIVDFLTFGVAIVAIIGITLAGITYLSAGDNEQKTTKAKRRIYEVIIGIVAYAALYATISFLLPGGRLNTSGTCPRVSSYNRTINPNDEDTLL